MMKPTEDGKDDDLSIRSRPLRRRCSGNSMLYALMRTGSVEKAHVLAEHGLQVMLSENDDVVQALAPNAAEKALANRIHQRSPNCCLHNADAGSFCHPVELRAELAVPVAEDDLSTLPERRDLAKLLSGPAFARLARHSEMNDLLRVYIDDEEREEGSKPDIVHLQKVAGPDCVVAQERAPTLTIRWWTHGAYVTLDRSLCDTNSELQKLASDSFGAPGPVLDRHAADELDGARGESRLALLGSDLPAMPPEYSEVLSVPTKDGLGLHEQHGTLPVGQNTCEQHHQAALPGEEARPFHGAGGDDELLAKGCVLGDQLIVRPADVVHEPCHERRGPQSLAHRRPDRPQRLANGSSDLGSEDGEHDCRCAPDQGELQDLSSPDFSTILRWTREVAKTTLRSPS